MNNIHSRINNRCPECGQDHNAVTIGLEHGGFITVPASAIRKTERKPRRKPKPKLKSHVITPDIFWPEEEEESY